MDFLAGGSVILDNVLEQKRLFKVKMSLIILC